MGFYEEIRRFYGDEAYDCLKKWRSLIVKLARQSCRRIFLLKCRSYGLFPTHIIGYVQSVHDLVVADSPYYREMDKVLRKFKQGTLNVEIKATIWRIDTVYKHLQRCKDKARFVLPEYIFRNYIVSMNNVREMEFFKVKYSLEKKMIALQASQRKGFFDYTGALAVSNLTDIEIPRDSLHLLSLGDKFAIEVGCKEDIPIFDLVSDIEKIFSCTRVDNTDAIRSNCVNLVTNYSHRIANSPNRILKQGIEIKQCFNKTKRFLGHQKDILVCRSDKAGNTVIMKKGDYATKMTDMLNDVDTYSKLKRDPSSSFRSKVNKLVDDLLTLKCIDYRTALSLKSFKGTAPRMYGLPKLHKVGIPFRPIVSFINSPTYELSRFIEKFLSRIVGDSEFNVKNSSEFKEAVLGQVLDDSVVLISLDVKSLFTNIPLDLAVNLVSQQWEKIGLSCGIPKQVFLSILELICEARYFTYGGQLYKQLFGLPMGSPISPVLANIVMVEVLRHCLSLLHTTVKFIKLYVDDLFLIVDKGKEQAVLNVFNSFHGRLQFTAEIEKEGMLSFLDVMVVRGQNGSVLTDWFIKPTSSGRILNYHSSHSMNQKINCVKNLVKKVIDVSSPCFLIVNKKRLQEILSNNGYPKNLVDRFWTEYLHTSLSASTVTQETPHRRFFKFPYVEGLSQGISKVFKRHIPEVTLAFYNKVRVKSLFSSLKDKLPKDLESNVVYAVNCKDCNQRYYGETSRFLRERMYQHSYSIRTKKVNATALAAHAVQKNHQFDFEDVRIVAREQDEQRRKTLEMLYIKKDSTSLNFRGDIDNLSNIYSGLLN